MWSAQTVLLIAGSLMAAAAVSVSGAIGFVGCHSPLGEDRDRADHRVLLRRGRWAPSSLCLPIRRLVQCLLRRTAGRVITAQPEHRFHLSAETAETEPLGSVPLCRGNIKIRKKVTSGDWKESA